MQQLVDIQRKPLAHLPRGAEWRPGLCHSGPGTPAHPGTHTAQCNAAVQAVQNKYRERESWHGQVQGHWRIHAVQGKQAVNPPSSPCNIPLNKTFSAHTMLGPVTAVVPVHTHTWGGRLPVSCTPARSRLVSRDSVLLRVHGRAGRSSSSTGHGLCMLMIMAPECAACATNRGAWMLVTWA